MTLRSTIVATRWPLRISCDYWPDARKPAHRDRRNCSRIPVAMCWFIWRVMAAMDFWNFKIQRKSPTMSWPMPLNKCGRSNVTMKYFSWLIRVRRRRCTRNSIRQIFWRWPAVWWARIRFRYVPYSVRCIVYNWLTTFPIFRFAVQHHVDPAIGVYIIDRYTYYALDFLERVEPNSQRTIGEFVSAYHWTEDFWCENALILIASLVDFSWRSARKVFASQRSAFAKICTRKTQIRCQLPISSARCDQPKCHPVKLTSPWQLIRESREYIFSMLFYSPTHSILFLFSAHSIWTTARKILNQRFNQNLMYFLNNFPVGYFRSWSK